MRQAFRVRSTAPTATPVSSAEPLLGYPDDGRHLAELAWELDPARAAIVAAVQVPVTAGREQQVRRVRLCPDHPHRRIRRNRQIDAFPAAASVAGAHECPRRAWRAVAN